ncbi:MAG: PKD domain-containing protein [Acetobacterium sp.]|uniref:PKD domain-containing protein n=1 Tax=Acetobacterium sp. TaxID=1872094 RepID=UPI0032429855
MKRQLKRGISLLLVCLMLVSSIPFNVLAEEQQVAEPLPKETVDAVELSEAIPGDDNPNAAVPSQEIQPEIAAPNTEVQGGQNLAAEESITTAATEDLTVTLKADKASPQKRNTTVVFTATATGGVAPYSYEFTLNGEIIESTADTATIEFTEAGTYSIEVTVTDATEAEAETTSTALEYLIRDNPLATLTIDPDENSNHYVNETVTLQAVVDGGTSPLSYRFYYQLGSAKKVEIKNPTIVDHNAQVSFTPVTAGSYTLLVEITDKDYLKTTAKTNLTVLAPVSAKSFTVDKPSGQNVGTTLKLTANGSGGKAPYTYEFEYQLAGGAAIPIAVEKEPAANTVEFTPETPGIYTFIVTIKDNEGLEDETTKTVEKTIDNYHVVNGPVIEDFTATNRSDPEKATYVNDSILLKVDLAEGTGTVADAIKYTYTIKNGSKTIKTITQSEDRYEFTPDSPGTYNFTVKAVDSDNLSATKTTSLVVLKPVKVTLKADKPSGQKIHTDIKLTATASGGEAPYSFEFEYEYQGETKVLQRASETKTTTFTIDDPEKTGKYNLLVKVTDANGDPADPAIAELIDYRITNPPVIDSFTADPAKGSAVYAGQAITLKASVTEGTGEKNSLDYQFYVNGKLLTSDSAGADLTQITSGICKYKPTTAGNYTFEVAVSDGVTTVKQKITSYKVLAGVEVTSLKADKPTGLIKDDTIKLTAAGKGGVGPYSYAFYYDFDDGTTTTEKNPIEAIDAKLKTISQKLGEAGEYTFYVEITDKNGTVSTNGLDKKIVVNVTDPPIITGLTVTDADDAKVTSSYAGEKITLTATPADTEADLIYSFSYKIGAKTTIITDELDEDGTADDEKATFTLPASGSYTFYVTATDNDDLTGPAFSLQKFTVYKAFAVKSLTTSKPSGQNTNTEIKLTAKATGGQAPYTYKFSKKLPEATEFTAITSDPTKNYVIDQNGDTEETQREAGTYTYQVVIKDANGIETKPYTIDFDFINPFTLALTVDKASQTVYQDDDDADDDKDKVTLTATVDTGTDKTSELDYRFYWKMGTETGEIATLTDTIERIQTAEFKPQAPGTYTLFVDVIDANDTLKTAKIASYKVLGTLTVDSLVVDQAAPQNIGTTIKLTANGSGGKTPYKYQFYYQFDALAIDGVDVTEWKEIGIPTTSKSITYRLAKAGTYQFKVQLIDGNGHKTEVEEADSNAVYQDYDVADKPIITRFTASPSLKQYVDTNIVLSAAAKGGSGTYEYDFSYSYVDDKGKTITTNITGDKSEPTVTFSDIEKPGTYQFKLTVTDTENIDDDTNTAEKIINYTIVNKPAIKTFSPDKTAIKTGSSVKLTAAGQYGIGRYQYKFYVKKDDGEPKMIRSFSSTPTFTYRAPTAGTYTFYVDIKDSKMITSGLAGEGIKVVEVVVTD